MYSFIHYDYVYLCKMYADIYVLNVIVKRKPHLPSTLFRYFFIFLPYKRTDRGRTHRT